MRREVREPLPPPSHTTALEHVVCEAVGSIGRWRPEALPDEPQPAGLDERQAVAGPVQEGREDLGAGRAAGWDPETAAGGLDGTE